MLREGEVRKESRVGLVLGDVLVAILPKRCFRQATLAGVRKRLIRVHFLVFRLIRVDRLVRGSARAVHIPAMPRAMLDLAHHVRRWVRLRTVSAARTPLQSVAKIPTTSMAGAVARFAVTFYPAANIPALGLVTKGFAGPVK